jgi:hypothetical protein
MGTEGTLSSVWDQHLGSEFATKSPDQALATMTAELCAFLCSHGSRDN